MIKSSGRRRGDKHRPHSDNANDILCYADQGSLLGLRALARGPILHFTWIYSHQPSDADILRFNERLAEGLLGRLVQRSVLPWGRHRWVANPAAAPVTWFHSSIRHEDLSDWRSSLVNLPIDPEYGPGWRLAVQSIAGGGCAISLLVSHTIADGQATSIAVAEAISGQNSTCHPPVRMSRWTPARLIGDCIESLRSLPELFSALSVLLQRCRSIAPEAGSRPPWPRRRSAKASMPAVYVPHVQIAMDRAAIEESSTSRSVSSNTLVASFTARLASRMGRIDASGRVTLVLPVSDRVPGDCRGNALLSVTLKIDPHKDLNEPRYLQGKIRSALASLLRRHDDLSAMFPLIPYVPIWLARRLERLALGSELPSGCSLLGALPEALNRPFGEASLVLVSLLERFTQVDLDDLQGQLFIVSHITGGRYMVSVAAYTPDQITNRAQLLPLVQEALSETGLSGEIF